MEISRPILDRLVLSRFLISEALRANSDGAPFATGRAVSVLQDAIELYLRALGEQFHAQVKSKSSFEELVSEVVKSIAPGTLPFRSSLTQLNAARVNFKHHAIPPAPEVSQKLLVEMDSFFIETLRSLLELEVAQVSLIRLLGHPRTEALLARAEEAIAVEKYEEAVALVAKALAVFSRRESGIEAPRPLRSSAMQRDAVDRLAETVDERFQDLHQQFVLLTYGVNLAEYQRFAQFAPHIGMSAAGTLWTNWRHHGQLGRDEALFAWRFVVDSLLSMSRSWVPPMRQRKHHADVALVVVCDTQVVVCPEDDARHLEVVRQVRAGERLASFSKAKPHEGYLPVLVGSDVYYIAATAVEVVAEQQPD